jgi:acetate kinase
MEHLEIFLGKLPLFQSFPVAELKRLIKEGDLKTFSPGDTIIEFGQPGRFLGIVLEGEAEAVITDKSGNRQRLGTVRPGDFLGEMSLLTGEPTSADVIALEECQLLLIPTEVFTTFIAANPAAVKVLAKTMSERLRRRQESEEEQSLLKEAWQRAPDPYGLELSTAEPMKILVLNSGSSSLKFSYFDTQDETNNLEGMVERIGLENSRLMVRSKRGETNKELGATNHSQALKAIVTLLTDRNQGVVGNLAELAAVGHRVVHGGDKYSNATAINAQVIEGIEQNSKLAPLHNPVNLMGIKEAIKLMPDVPQVAVFDTGFHQKMPPHAHLYGLPYQLYEEDRIRRYGFHGISHNYVTLKAASYLRRDYREMKLITCHLGNGASICAIDHGQSIDTSMGFTPLEGLIMGTRCGDLDPSITSYLCREKGYSLEEVDKILNYESGLKGLSGLSSDLREIEEMASKGNSRALVTINTFCYRIRKYIGAYVAALGGLDGLVFTGGIGEGSAWVRGLSCQGLEYIGIEVDDIRNRTVSPGSKEVSDITGEHSRIKVMVIPTHEEKFIARETIRTLNKQKVTQLIRSQEERGIPIEVSAHHVHLCQKEVAALFGEKYGLTKRTDLSQPGQFACNETVDLIGPKGRVDRVRILGPIRNQTQVEISMTEEFKLGIKAPIRLSGDLAGSPGVTMETASGSCQIPIGVICAQRHIHMSPEDALSFGLRDRDVVMVVVKGERTLTFGDVLVRVAPDFKLSMHIDTDEANAANISEDALGYLAGVQERR